MKKKWAIFLWILSLSVVWLLFWCTSKYISKKDVQSIVLEDSHWTLADVKFEEIELDRDLWIYDVEFIANGEYEYEYQVNAVNWEIIVDDDFVVYSVDDAIDIAILDAGSLKENIDVKSKNMVKIWDLSYYKIVFVEWWFEYKYVISATDGTIYSSDRKILED